MRPSSSDSIASTHEPSRTSTAVGAATPRPGHTPDPTSMAAPPKSTAASTSGLTVRARVVGSEVTEDAVGSELEVEEGRVLHGVERHGGR